MGSPLKETGEEMPFSRIFVPVKYCHQGAGWGEDIRKCHANVSQICQHPPQGFGRPLVSFSSKCQHAGKPSNLLKIKNYL